jgi:hypothetical protein
MGPPTTRSQPRQSGTRPLPLQAIPPGHFPPEHLLERRALTAYKGFSRGIAFLPLTPPARVQAGLPRQGPASGFAGLDGAPARPVKASRG